MPILDDIAFFFAPPVPLQQGGTFSTLHLLRREIQDCLIGRVIEENAVVAAALQEPHRLFATMMVTMAGIDLLAKFHGGSDQIGQVGPRIKDFAKTFMFVGAADPDRYAEVLYQGLRNPLLHSFTFHNEHLTIWVVSGRPQAAVYPNAQDPNHFILSVEGIYSVFVQAVNAYHAALLASQDLQQKFEAMYHKYGTLGVGAL